VDNTSRQTKVGRHQISNIGSRQIRNTVGLHCIDINHEVRGDNFGCVISGKAGRIRRAVEQQLGHEWEVLRTPGVGIVKSHGEDNTSQVADTAVDQRLHGEIQRRSETSNVVPVKGDGSQSHALITLGTTKQVGEYQVVLVSQAEDGNTDQNREDILVTISLFHGQTILGGIGEQAYLGEPLPHEQSGKNDPKHLESLASLGFGTVQGFHDGGDGQIGRVQHLGRPQQNTAHHAGHTVPDELRRHGDEDSRRSVGVASVPQLLHCQSLRGQSRDGRGRGHDDGRGVLLSVERPWVEEAANGTPSRDKGGHCVAQRVGEDGQEHGRDIDDLRLEVEDLLQHCTERRKAQSCLSRQLGNWKIRIGERADR
jgi:hypothetical protein